MKFFYALLFLFWWSAADEECIDDNAAVAAHPMAIQFGMFDCESAKKYCAFISSLCRITCESCAKEKVVKQMTQNGRMPMGHIDGKPADIFYTFTEDQVDWRVVFPARTSWLGFQFWSMIQSPFDNFVEQGHQTVGYEIMVVDPDKGAEGLEFRGRTVHTAFITGNIPEETPSAPLWECTRHLASVDIVIEQTGDSQKLCQWSKGPEDRSIGINAGPFTYITGRLEDNEADFNLKSVKFEDGYYTVEFSRSRAFPLHADGPSFEWDLRWALGDSHSRFEPDYYFVSDIPFHGHNSKDRQAYSSDKIYLYQEDYEKAWKDPSCNKKRNYCHRRTAFTEGDSLLNDAAVVGGRVCENPDRLGQDTKLRGSVQRSKQFSLCDCQDYCETKNAWAVAFKKNEAKPIGSKCLCYVRGQKPKKVVETKKKGYVYLVLHW